MTEYHEDEPTYEQLLEANHEMADRIYALTQVIIGQSNRLADGARGLLSRGWREGFGAGLLAGSIHQESWPQDPYDESEGPDFEAILTEFEGKEEE